MNRFSAMAVVVAGFSLGASAATTQVIGVAMSEGTIVVNDAQTPGNATILDGSTLQTQRSSSQVRLKDGAQLRLDADSRGKLFTDHVDLQQGSARISGYTANASGLSVRAADGSSASVAMKGDVVEIAALTGNVHVFNAAGMNVANLLPGRALDLRPQDAGASSPSSLVGCPVKSGDNFLLTDETSNVTAQLRGGKIKAGRHVKVTGSLVPNSTPVSPATQVISVTNVESAPGSCKKVGAAAAGAAGAGAAGAAAGGAAAGGAAAGVGLSTAAIAGIAVGGATAAGLGAAAATGAIGGSTSSGK